MECRNSHNDLDFKARFMEKSKFLLSEFLKKYILLLKAIIFFFRTKRIYAGFD